MRVAFFPNGWRKNPYLVLLEGALGELGVDVHPPAVEAYRPYRHWLAAHRGTVDVLHFHWLQYLYLEDTYRGSLARVLKFAAQLGYARHLGFRIVWTMHNEYPHKRTYPHLDHWARRLLLLSADAVIVHCRAAEALLRRSFGGNHPIFLAPLGNYAGVYSNTISRAEARSKLGLGDARSIYLYLGYLRAYKGLEQLIGSFRSITDTGLVLVISGWTSESEYARYIGELAGSDSRIQFRSGWVPDEEMQIYFQAADAVVYPFERVLTSSAAMLAMSFGRPVIAPALGCLPELVVPEAGILYDPTVADGLRSALMRSMTMDLEAMGQHAYRFAQSHTWRSTAEAVYAAYAGTQSKLPSSPRSYG